MAIVVESTGGATWTSSTRTTISIAKPTGLAVGDLMIAQICTGRDDGGATDPSRSGWTLMNNTLNTTGAGAQGSASALLWKIADSGDVAGSGFDFTASARYEGRNNGRIIRISGIRNVNPVQGTTATTAGVTTTPSVAITQTPTIPNSLLLIFQCSDGNTTGGAGYAIATSNPSWTEVYDESETTSWTTNMSCAWGIRPEITATGNVSMTGSSGSSWTIQLVVVSPAQDATYSDTITLIDSNTSAITKEISDTIFLTEETNNAKSRLWTNKTKPSTTWVNKQK